MSGALPAQTSGDGVVGRRTHRIYLDPKISEYESRGADRTRLSRVRGWSTGGAARYPGPGKRLAAGAATADLRDAERGIPHRRRIPSPLRRRKQKLAAGCDE